MTARKHHLVAVGLLGLALALPCRSDAAPGQTFHFQFKGLSADAFFDSFDGTGCVETSAEITPFNDRSKMGGSGPEVFSAVSVSLFQYDSCSQTALFSAFAFVNLPAGAFQIKQNLSSATLNTTIDVFDGISGTTFPVDISISWTGTGPITASHEHFIFRAPGFRQNFHLNGKSNPATASGSVTVGGTNFTPSPSTSAVLVDVKQGVLDVQH